MNGRCGGRQSVCQHTGHPPQRLPSGKSHSPRAAEHTSSGADSESRMSAVPQPGSWEFWIDRGGTFTDIVARRPDGALVAHKLLSDTRSSTATRRLPASASAGSSTGRSSPRRAHRVGQDGTTVATNALLERKGEPTVLVITSGFRDALRIAYQNGRACSSAGSCCRNCSTRASSRPTSGSARMVMS